MIEQITIETERLYLKAVTPAFISNLFETASEAAIKAYFQCGDEEYKVLQTMHEKGLESYRNTLFYFLMFEKSSGLIIGECGFHTWNTAHRKADIYYRLKDGVWKNRGYMSEAVKALLNYGFENLNLHRVQALVASDNVPSLRLLQKFGFRKEGTLKEDYLVGGTFEDSECYALLKREYAM